MSCISIGPTDPMDIVSDQIILTVSERLNKKYGWKLSAIGGSANKEGVSKLNASYHRRGLKMTDIEEARELILDAIKEFLNEANTNEDFKPLMKDYPFTTQNLSIGIINYDEIGMDVYFPYISDISVGSGKIDYSSLGPEGFSYVRQIKETYEEALERSALRKKREMEPEIEL